ncbi:MAG: 30S ribosomal protein S16 [Spirochaetia bacterium]
MVKIRLKRIGTAKRPYYRIVAVDSRKPRDGAVLEELGYYRPVEKDEFKVDAAQVKTWIERGAQMTDTVKNLFRRNKVMAS